MFTKNNLPTVLTITLLVLTTGVLFWYGQSKIQQAQDIQTTIIAWENLNSQIDLPFTKSNNLNLVIKNLESQKNTYQIKFLLNNKIIDSQKIEVQAKQKITIQPTEKTLNEIEKLVAGNKEMLYQVKITWGKKNSETLGKWLEINE